MGGPRLPPRQLQLQLLLRLLLLLLLMLLLLMMMMMIEERGVAALPPLLLLLLPPPPLPRLLLPPPPLPPAVHVPAPPHRHANRRQCRPRRLPLPSMGGEEMMRPPVKDRRRRLVQPEGGGGRDVAAVAAAFGEEVEEGAVMGSPAKEKGKRMLPPFPPPSMQRWGVLPPSPPRGRHSGDAARSHQRAAGAREIGGRRGACDIPEASARSVAHSPRAFAVGWGGQDADHLHS